MCVFVFVCVSTDARLFCGDGFGFKEGQKWLSLSVKNVIALRTLPISSYFSCKSTYY